MPKPFRPDAIDYATLRAAVVTDPGWRAVADQGGVQSRNKVLDLLTKLARSHADALFNAGLGDFQGPADLHALASGVGEQRWLIASPNPFAGGEAVYGAEALGFLYAGNANQQVVNQPIDAGRRVLDDVADLYFDLVLRLAVSLSVVRREAKALLRPRGVSKDFGRSLDDCFKHMGGKVINQQLLAHLSGREEVEALLADPVERIELGPVVAWYAERVFLKAETEQERAERDGDQRGLDEADQTIRLVEEAGVVYQFDTDFADKSPAALLAVWARNRLVPIADLRERGEAAINNLQRRMKRNTLHANHKVAGAHDPAEGTDQDRDGRGGGDTSDQILANEARVVVLAGEAEIYDTLAKTALSLAGVVLEVDEEDGAHCPIRVVEPVGTVLSPEEKHALVGGLVRRCFATDRPINGAQVSALAQEVTTWLRSGPREDFNGGPVADTGELYVPAKWYVDQLTNRHKQEVKPGESRSTVSWDETLAGAEGGPGGLSRGENAAIRHAQRHAPSMLHTAEQEALDSLEGRPDPHDDIDPHSPLCLAMVEALLDGRERAALDDVDRAALAVLERVDEFYNLQHGAKIEKAEETTWPQFVRQVVAADFPAVKPQAVQARTLAAISAAVHATASVGEVAPW